MSPAGRFEQSRDEAVSAAKHLEGIRPFPQLSPVPLSLHQRSPAGRKLESANLEGQSPAAAKFDQLDMNGDGVIDRAEFTQGFSKGIQSYHQSQSHYQSPSQPHHSQLKLSEKLLNSMQDSPVRSLRISPDSLPGERRMEDSQFSWLVSTQGEDEAASSLGGMLPQSTMSSLPVASITPRGRAAEMVFGRTGGRKIAELEQVNICQAVSAIRCCHTLCLCLCYAYSDTPSYSLPSTAEQVDIKHMSLAHWLSRWLNGCLTGSLAHLIDCGTWQ